jgi:hypothetical protein
VASQRQRSSSAVSSTDRRYCPRARDPVDPRSLPTPRPLKGAPRPLSRDRIWQKLVAESDALPASSSASTIKFGPTDQKGRARIFPRDHAGPSFERSFKMTALPQLLRLCRLPVLLRWRALPVTGGWAIGCKGVWRLLRLPGWRPLRGAALPPMPRCSELHPLSRFLSY